MYEALDPIPSTIKNKTKQTKRIFKNVISSYIWLAEIDVFGQT